MVHMAHDINFDHLLPDGQELKPFQTTGVAYALMAAQDGKGVMIGDEMGLGKTAQGIVLAKLFAAAHSIEAPKFLFVVPPSLKGNWEKEINRFAPEWDVQILLGKRPYALVGNVAIIGYNLLSTWAKALIAEGFTAVTFDESHKVKDPSTLQTKAALKVAADVRSRKGLVALLSGTPFLNRPVELVSQLQMMGRIEEIAPLPRYGTSDKDWEFSFKNTFCAPKKVYRGRQSFTEYKGASRQDLMNTNLRNRCYVRRLRSEVLNMTETHRIHMPLSLNGDLDPYWEVEKNFQAKDPRSFMLELLTQLRITAGVCKIPAAVEWVKTFIEENEGKKLVAWAWHIEVQQELTNALNAAGIEAIYLKGEQDKGQIEEAKARFNEGTAQVIVCSLQAHREGHTLLGDGTNVTDSLFVEQPWHCGAVAQAEDRISRIGRTAEAVFAHTLIVPGTVDTWLEDMIASKWATFKAGADGTISDWNESSAQKEMMDRLAAHLRAKYGEGRLPQPPQEEG
jgi:SNF2 family DNA or RNA helicase